MPCYKITYQNTIDSSYEVEADNFDEALEQTAADHEEFLSNFRNLPGVTVSETDQTDDEEIYCEGGSDNDIDDL